MEIHINKIGSKKYSRFQSIILLLLLSNFLYLSFDGWQKLSDYSNVFYKNPTEILSQLDDGQMYGYSSVTQDNTISAKIFMLSGCAKLDSLDLHVSESIIATINKRHGKLKMLFINEQGGTFSCIVLSQESTQFNLEAGAYQIVAVGDWFSGNFTISEVR